MSFATCFVEIERKDEGELFGTGELIPIQGGASCAWRHRENQVRYDEQMELDLLGEYEEMTRSIRSSILTQLQV